MKTELCNYYMDRETGALQRERIYAGGFLRWSYNTRIGLALTNLIFSHVLISRLYGWYQHTRWSRRRIEPFIQRLHIDVTESERPVSAYCSFGEFFVRTLRKDARPISPEPTVCVAPVDGKVLAYQAVSKSTILRVKRHEFTLESFLRNSRLAEQYDGGALIICRLGLSDYHHVHFPDSGVPRSSQAINGVLFAGGPYALRHVVPFYGRNLRMLTKFESDHFGRILIVEVGAFTVGSIHQRFVPGMHVSKGARKAYFELGGSTIVLLFQSGRIDLDRDLLSHTSCGLETYVRMGQRIGIARERTE